MRFITASIIALPFYLLSCKNGDEQTMTLIVVITLLVSTFIFAMAEE